MDERTFTLAEAKQLLPQLEERLLAVKQEKEVLVRSHGEVKRASAKVVALRSSGSGFYSLCSDRWLWQSSPSDWRIRMLPEG